MIKARIKMSTKEEDVEDANLIFNALNPDLQKVSKRSSLKISPETDGLKVDIKSKDLIAFRANLNSFLRTLFPVKEILKNA